MSKVKLNNLWSNLRFKKEPKRRFGGRSKEKSNPLPKGTSNQ